MIPKPRFAFYEKVRIRTNDPAKAHLNGEVGAVIGRTETEDRTSWYYAVSLDKQHRVWCFDEHELEPTGEYARREDFFDGTLVKVRVDKQGRGTIEKPETED